MPRRKEDLEKITIRLHSGDKEELEEYYPQLGHNKVIRSLVRSHIKQLRAKLEQERNNNESINPDDITSITLD